MTVLLEILNSVDGLLLLVALAFSAIGLWRMYLLTELRPWLVALIALGLVTLLHVALIVGVAARYRLKIGWLDHLPLITADLTTLAYSALFLAVARALVLMARSREKT